MFFLTVCFFGFTIYFWGVRNAKRNISRFIRCIRWFRVIYCNFQPYCIFCFILLLIYRNEHVFDSCEGVLPTNCYITCHFINFTVCAINRINTLLFVNRCSCLGQDYTLGMLLMLNSRLRKLLTSTKMLCVLYIQRKNDFRIVSLWSGIMVIIL